MSAQHEGLSRHPAPHRHRVAALESIFGLLGAPLAWLLQLDAAYAMASWPCFPKDHRQPLPDAAFAWTAPAMLIAMLAAVAIALAAVLVSWRSYRRTRGEGGGGAQQLLQAGTGRTRFLALWGMLLGAGFAIATLAGAFAVMVLPRCAG
jgi:hypothetical protein